MTYNVKLEIFEGPLDLLLHLIKKNEVDIYDIPIAAITEEYLHYIEMMREMNLTLAGEFVLMAATLIHIKSRMLLPIQEEGEGEEEGIDPREELTRKLIEYQRFKNASEELSRRLILGRDVFTRGVPFPIGELEGDETVELSDVSVFQLVEAFREILRRVPRTYTIDITVDRFKVKDKINRIMEILDKEKSVLFNDLFPADALRGEMIVTFLAILELVKLLLLKVNQTDDGTIRVYRPMEEIHAETFTA